jgi:hypothetical protein
MTMDDAALQTALRRLFERHEVELEPDEDGWLLTDGDFPAIRAHWRAGEGGEPGRLDVDVVVAEDRCIEDSFAGTDAREALGAFEQSSFHLLLAACWYITDDRRMRIAAWDIGVRTWDVFVGPLVTRPSAAEPQPMSTDAALALQQAVGQLALPRNCTDPCCIARRRWRCHPRSAARGGRRTAPRYWQPAWPQLAPIPGAATGDAGVRDY